MKIHRVRLRTQVRPMPNIAAYETYVRSLFVAVCEKKEKPPHE